MFPPGSTGCGVFNIDPHVILVEQIDIISLFDGSFVKVSDLFTGENGWRGVHVVWVESGFDGLSPRIESLLVGLGIGDRGT